MCVISKFKVTVVIVTTCLLTACGSSHKSGHKGPNAPDGPGGPENRTSPSGSYRYTHAELRDLAASELDAPDSTMLSLIGEDKPDAGEYTRRVVASEGRAVKLSKSYARIAQALDDQFGSVRDPGGLSLSTFDFFKEIYKESRDLKVGDSCDSAVARLVSFPKLLTLPRPPGCEIDSQVWQQDDCVTGAQSADFVEEFHRSRGPLQDEGDFDGRWYEQTVASLNGDSFGTKKEKVLTSQATSNGIVSESGGILYSESSMLDTSETYVARGLSSTFTTVRNPKYSIDYELRGTAKDTLTLRAVGDLYIGYSYSEHNEVKGTNELDGSDGKYSYELKEVATDKFSFHIKVEDMPVDVSDDDNDGEDSEPRKMIINRNGRYEFSLKEGAWQQRSCVVTKVGSSTIASANRHFEI